MNIEAFFKISYGLYLVGSKDNDKINAHVSNTVFQVSSDPLTLAICSNKKNYTTDMILNSKVFSISILSTEVDLKFIGPFGFKCGKDIDKFTNYQHKIGSTGSPILTEKTIGYFECEVINQLDAGTHMMFLGKVKEAEIINNDLQPLTYDYYRNVIKGKSPKNAPTHIE